MPEAGCHDQDYVVNILVPSVVAMKYPFGDSTALVRALNSVPKLEQRRCVL
jgi:hypothetical protein